LDESIASAVREFPAPPNSAATSSLYLIADIFSGDSTEAVKAVIAGKRTEFQDGTMTSTVKSAPLAPLKENQRCIAGSKAAEQLRLNTGAELRVRNSGREENCRVEIAPARGDESDSQIAMSLEAAQRLASLPGRISLVQLSVAGTPREIGAYIAALAQKIPSADVHGLRQFTGAEAKIYYRISGLLSATVSLVLVLTGLCVMAAMTNVAMERRNDVGLMKAIGGATRRVLRLFLAEAALLGLTGGIFGATVGILLSIWLGKTVFGVAARPRLIVYPVSVALTILVAIISAYPLRRLTKISPAAVFRGEA
jgi:putative ABC transport system permease protein